MIDNMQHCHRRNLNVFLILIVKPNSVWLWLRWLRECYMEAFEWLCSVQYQKFVFNRPTTAKLHPRQRILDGLHFKYILFLRNHVQDYSDATGWCWWWWRQTDVRGSLAWSAVSDSTLLQANCILDVAFICAMCVEYCTMQTKRICCLYVVQCTLHSANCSGDVQSGQTWMHLNVWTVSAPSEGLPLATLYTILHLIPCIEPVHSSHCTLHSKVEATAVQGLRHFLRPPL